uniref:Uncharacterized protein n=1 Tax=Candidatus Kentrum sp. TUN TaxID=2126343 RepID=A0A451AE98_9GAMM|nr:MAG: hypothetical protein BECKTUN1418D_GA0071000_12574 [Candidatus Kentron sp. TUN]
MISSVKNTTKSHSLQKLENILFWTSIGGAVGACTALGVILSGLFIGSIVSMLGTITGGVFGAFVAILINRRIDEGGGHTWENKKLSVLAAIKSIANPWLKIFSVLALLSFVGTAGSFRYVNNIGSGILLSAFILVIALFLAILITLHKQHLHAQQDREKLLEEMRDMVENKHRSS